MSSDDDDDDDSGENPYSFIAPRSRETQHTFAQDPLFRFRTFIVRRRPPSRGRQRVLFLRQIVFEISKRSPL